jgi:shikimate kinase
MSDGAMIPLPDLLGGVSLFLVGMMGSGKSTLGPPLAQQLRYTFFDTDSLIEKASGSSIPDLFAQGEEGFRTLETQVLAELASYRSLVVATGGGIVLKRENWSYLQHGVVIWLDVPPEIIWQRLHQDPASRPLLATTSPKATLQKLSQERRSLYAQADLHIPITAESTVIDSINYICTQLVMRIRSAKLSPQGGS